MIMGCLVGKFPKGNRDFGFTSCSIPGNWVSPKKSSPCQASLVPGVNGGLYGLKVPGIPIIRR